MDTRRDYNKVPSVIMRCARCWSKDWASSRTKIWELPLRLFGLTPVRCGGCGRRDYRGPVDSQIRLRLRIPKPFHVLAKVEASKPRSYRYPRTSGGRFARAIKVGGAWLERIRISGPRRFYKGVEGVSAATWYNLKTPSRMLHRALGPRSRKAKSSKAWVVSSPTRVSLSVYDRVEEKTPAPDPSTRDAA